MKRNILKSAALLVSAAALVACGAQSGPAHEGIYESKESLGELSEWNGSLGTAERLLGKKVSFDYTEKIKVLVDAHGGNSDFSSFRTDVTATTHGYIDFSATDFYAYVVTEYADANNPKTNYKKEGLIRKAADGSTYETITTADGAYTNLGNVYGAFGATFGVISSVANTKATHLGAGAMILNSDINQWLYEMVGLSSTAGEGVEDWEDTEVTYGTTEEGDLVFKAAAPHIGYTTDQGVSDFGFSYKGSVADVYGKVGADGYLTAWDVDLIGERCALDFNIMDPVPTVTPTGARSFRANYNAAEETHKADIDHAEPAETKYATFSVEADNGVVGYSAYRMVINGMNPEGMAPITNVGKDALVDNLWFAVQLQLADGVTVTSVKVNGEDALPMAGMYCVKAEAEGNYAFTVVTDAPASTVAKVSVIADDGVTEAVAKYLVAPNFGTQTAIPEEGVEVVKGLWIVINPTLAAGKTVKTVLANGVDITATAAQFSGFYGVEAKAGFFQLTIVTE